MNDRGEYKGYHPGIYRFCAEEVHAEQQFRLPYRLPWMPDTAASTEELLKEAVLTTEPEPVPEPKARKKAGKARATSTWADS